MGHIFHEESTLEDQLREETTSFHDDWDKLTAKPYQEQSFSEKVFKPYNRWLKRLIKGYTKKLNELTTIEQQRKVEANRHKTHLKELDKDYKTLRREFLNLKLAINRHKNNGGYNGDLDNEEASMRDDFHEAKANLEFFTKETIATKDEHRDAVNYMILMKHKITQANEYKATKYNKRN